MKALLAVIIFSAFLIGSVAAAPIEAVFENNNISAVSGNPAGFDIKITNVQPFEDSFTIVVKGAPLAWKFPGTIFVTLGPDASTSVSIDFVPISEVEGIYEYQAIISSWRDPAISVTKPFWLTVYPAISVTDLKISQTTDKIDITATVVSDISRSAELAFDILDKQGKVVRSSSTSVQLTKSQIVSHSISTQGLLAGDYTLRASISNSNMSKPFTIAPVRNVVESTETVPGFLAEEVRISLANNGNTPEYGYKVTKSITTDWFTGFATAPQKCVVDGRQQECTFSVDIQPGQTAMVVYSIQYWPTIAEWGLLTVIIIGGIAIYFFRLTRPKIVKKVTKQGETEYAVTLEIKAAPMKAAENVLVRDVVSPLVHLFHTGHIKPVERRDDRGVELLWRIGSLKPKETHIISYKIKTPFEGSFRLNPAAMRYETKSGKRSQVLSGSVMIE